MLQYSEIYETSKGFTEFVMIGGFFNLIIYLPVITMMIIGAATMEATQIKWICFLYLSLRSLADNLYIASVVIEDQISIRNQSNEFYCRVI